MALMSWPGKGGNGSPRFHQYWLILLGVLVYQQKCALRVPYRLRDCTARIGIGRRSPVIHSWYFAAPVSAHYFSGSSRRKPDHVPLSGVVFRGEIDELNELLEKWTVRTAKYALDEIEGRLRVIEELRAKTSDRNTDEVRELQPLFENALWIFVPEFESIEFTSNETMATVIQRYLKSEQRGSRNRPDFVMTPDSSLGFYSLPDFDRETHNVTGVRRLVSVELKKPSVTIGSEEKGQVWKYVKELVAKGLVSDATTVTGFVLGEQIDPTEVTPRSEGRNVSIRPLLYSSFILQAEKRMFSLRKRLQEAPVLKDKGLVEFVKVDTGGRDLFSHRMNA